MKDLRLVESRVQAITGYPVIVEVKRDKGTNAYHAYLMAELNGIEILDSIFIVDKLGIDLFNRIVKEIIDLIGEYTHA